MDCRSRRRDTLSEIHSASYSYGGPCCARWTLYVPLRRSPFCDLNCSSHVPRGLWTLHHEWLCIKVHSRRLSLIPAQPWACNPCMCSLTDTESGHYLSFISSMESVAQSPQALSNNELAWLAGGLSIVKGYLCPILFSIKHYNNHNQFRVVK